MDEDAGLSVDVSDSDVSSLLLSSGDDESYVDDESESLDRLDESDDSELGWACFSPPPKALSR